MKKGERDTENRGFTTDNGITDCFIIKSQEGSNMGRKIERFEDLEVWQEGMRLTIEIHNLLKNCRDCSLRDQIHRSSVSIPSNIAEGFERQTNKEFIYFLYISKGSSGELRTQLYIAMELTIIGKEIGVQLVDRCEKISSMLYNLIQRRRRDF